MAVNRLQKQPNWSYSASLRTPALFFVSITSVCMTADQKETPGTCSVQGFVSNLQTQEVPQRHVVGDGGQILLQAAEKPWGRHLPTHAARFHMWEKLFPHLSLLKLHICKAVRF